MRNLSSFYTYILYIFSAIVVGWVTKTIPIDRVLNLFHILATFLMKVKSPKKEHVEKR